MSIKTDINRNGFNLIYSKGSKAFKTQLAAAWFAMWLNHCNFDVNWTMFPGFLKLRIHNSVFRGFWWVSVISEFSFRAQNENQETTKNRYFWVIKLKCMWICFMITILTFWVSKTNSINLVRSEALKRQIPATLTAIRLNDFEFDFEFEHISSVLKLHPHIKVLWFFCEIFITSEFSFLGVGL